MNFLAHIALSMDKPDIIIGNFIGDFVKGDPSDDFRPEIVKGIILHRKIDFFTDHHSVVSDSKARLRENYRHYASVIVDMYYDHFLSRNWNDFYDVPLAEYVEEVYKMLKQNHEILPIKVNEMLVFMTKQNWLVNYGTFDGLERAFKGLSKRTRFESGMENAVVDLHENYDLFEKEFRDFYPVLRAYASNELE